MGVLFRFTLASLKKNRVRTAVTVLGIILSMTLFTAVLAGADSGLSWMKENETVKNGGWMGLYRELDGALCDRALAQDFIKDVTRWETVGWASFENRNEYKPYLLIRSMGDDPNGLVHISLLTGRMPQNEGEILLPDHLKTVGGVDPAQEKTLTLLVGRRTAGGEELTPLDMFDPGQGEQLTDCTARTYTVVGTYARLSYDIESYSCPGYTALTTGSTQTIGQTDLFFTVDDPGGLYELTAKDGELNARLAAHSDLLILYGTARDSGLVGVLTGLAGILIVLIVFGSVSLIYNSFSISVSERLKQFGMLRSVGATKKQVRLTVLYEGLVLCGIGIPAGMGLGLLGLSAVLRYLRDDFTRVFAGYADSVPIRVSVRPWILLLAVALCLLTVLVSAAIPAQKAIRASAVEAIRQTGEVRYRTPRGGALSGKLFGFGGKLAGRNYARSRRRYRVTILSLALSLVLFISSTSFCDYLRSYLNAYTANMSHADLLYSEETTDGEDGALPRESERLADLRGLPHVDGVTRLSAVNVGLWVPVADVTDGLRGMNGTYRVLQRVDTSLQFLDEETFSSYCQANGLDPADYHRTEAPLAVAVNHIDLRDYEGGQMRYYSMDVLKDSAVGVPLIFWRARQLPGYDYQYLEADEYGAAAWYMPLEAEPEAADGAAGGPGSGTDAGPEPVSRTDTVEAVQLVIGALLPAAPAGTARESSMLSLIYPESMRDVILPETAALRAEQTTVYSIMAADNAAAEQEIYRYLEDAGIIGDLYNEAAERENFRMALKILEVFSACFILLMALIAVVNVYNTISTNIRLRRREFAVLKSVGMGKRDFSRMMLCESLLYISRSLVLGLALAFLFTYAVYRVVGQSLTASFYVPWISVLIAVAGVILIVLLTAGRAAGRRKGETLADELKLENT